ncbi:MAG: hypothetical protein ACUZ8H_14095, partial [Candidatus Anammoxibacter sp.]
IWEDGKFKGSLILNLEFTGMTQTNIADPLGLAAIICTVKIILNSLRLQPKRLDTKPPDCAVAYQLGDVGFVMLQESEIKKESVLDYVRGKAATSDQEIRKVATPAELESIKKFIFDTQVEI